MQNEIGSLKGEIQKLESELRKREAIISSLKVDIDGLRREIQERDDTIQVSTSIYVRAYICILEHQQHYNSMLKYTYLFIMNATNTPFHIRTYMYSM